MKRRSIVAGYAVIGLIGLGLALAVHDFGSRNEREVLNHYLSSEHAKTLAVADRVETALQSIYENLRTLSLLPSTRTISRHGENLSDEARLTFQQVYNNLVSSVSVSEVYILPAELNPDHVDPVTGKLEAPKLMFDQLIVDARDRFTERNLRGQLPIRTDTSYEDEIETFEYHEMQQQLGFLKQRYPLLSGIEGLSLPMIASPELITCDNTAFIHTLADADRSGVVFTVPFYGSDEGLRGAVSAIILSSALKALLPGRDSSLVNVGHGYALGLGDGGQQKLSAEKVRAGRPDETLLYSEAVPVTSAIEDYPYAV